jgi:hypothetical protein
LKLSVLLLFSLVLHAVVIVGWQYDALRSMKNPGLVEIRIVKQAREIPPDTPPPAYDKAAPPASIATAPTRQTNKSPIPRPAAGPAPKTPASLTAPPPPSADEWQLASTYKLKNSKRYRHNWSQQVRSMMGTAVEGPEQGMVRFRIEIAPDGTLAHATELWSTSKTASERAWQAIKSLPPLPPTPTGKSLIFERTISFMPYETGWPPSYTLDCLPDQPAFKNPFAWDGTSPQAPAQHLTVQETTTETDDEQVKCVTDSTADTIEQEEGELKRQTEIWRWGR